MMRSLCLHWLDMSTSELPAAGAAERRRRKEDIGVKEVGAFKVTLIRLQEGKKLSRERSIVEVLRDRCKNL
ncbi:hypothetical protein chiPu_0010300 [Chiloscyllium punctatum]|uniref:Uncharacterized protein n=1 Tax=Chiloscyllium punctatum TaxID=137246 RepID=A0A401SN74_CHIPU|nr:hypothetical protein [Chiloscyllium punctatum]